MPALNHKGPVGQGPMTGRRMGRCTNFGANPKKQTGGENENPAEDLTANTAVAESDFGRGGGFGFGRRCGGAGRGMGRQNRFRGGA